MAFYRQQHLQLRPEEILLVPTINVILLLTIFFLLTSPLCSPVAINVKAPKAVTSDILRDENFIILINSEDVIYFNNSVFTIKELRTALAAFAKTKRPILIKADRRASMGRLVDVWNLCRQLGIEGINITTNREK